LYRKYFKILGKQVHMVVDRSARRSPRLPCH